MPTARVAERRFLEEVCLDSGSGKSTLVEAIAESFGLDAGGGRLARMRGRPDPAKTPLGEVLGADTVPLGIVDWELWGRGPVGTDAATLHCYSLAVPGLAERVREEFPVLDTPDGRSAQLYAVARLLHRVRLGDHPRLAGPLRALAAELLR